MATKVVSGADFFSKYIKQADQSKAKAATFLVIATAWLSPITAVGTVTMPDGSVFYNTVYWNLPNGVQVPLGINEDVYHATIQDWINTVEGMIAPKFATFNAVAGLQEAQTTLDGIPDLQAALGACYPFLSNVTYIAILALLIIRGSDAARATMGKFVPGALDCTGSFGNKIADIAIWAVKGMTVADSRDEISPPAQTPPPASPTWAEGDHCYTSSGKAGTLDATGLCQAPLGIPEIAICYPEQTIVNGQCVDAVSQIHSLKPLPMPAPGGGIPTTYLLIGGAALVGLLLARK